ncbi:MAG: hypothetical protein ACRDJH_24815 [Thermomicrobiales bacterium]
MAEGTREFGVSDLEYDLVITLGNLLQGVEVMTKYANDAGEAGDDECAHLFSAMRDQHRVWAIQVRSTLARHVSKAH